MQAYTQAFNDAIRSADREMKAYIKFNGDNTKIMSGEDGLIQFVVTQQVMEQERFCIGGAVSFRCEASFYNSGIPAGVSLANSYFDAYVGIKVVPGDSDTFEAIPEQTVYLSGSPALLSNADFEVLADGTQITLTVNGDSYSGEYNSAGFNVYGSPGVYYTLSPSGGSWLFSGTIYSVDPEIDLTGSFVVSATADAFEYKTLGRFYIAEISRGKETTSVVAYDVMNKLSDKYVPTVTKGPSGYLAKDILNDIIAQTGVQGGTPLSSSIYNFYVPEIVDATMRETWGWLILCAHASSRPGANCYGSINTPGNIAMRSYSLGADEFTNYPAITDDQIYLDGLTLGDTFTITSLTTGTQDNPIVFGSGVGINSPNPYITSAQANTIYTALNGISYTPMTLHFRGDPCVSVFDSLKVTQGATDYRCVAMKITSTFNGGFEQTIDCWGDSEAFYEMSYSPMESKIQTNNTLIKEMAKSIETARGGVITQILDADGTWMELCIANSQDLNTATSVWRFNINGLAHSNRYSGGTYTFALDDQGRIVATLIQTGILQDALGKNYWNLDTGDFQITNGSIRITTSNQSQDLINLTWSNGGNSGENTLTPSGHTVWNYDASLNRTNSATINSGYLTSRYYTGNFGTLQGVASVSGVEGFKLLDGNQTDRAVLGLTGLTFYNASGTQTALYPSTGFAKTNGTSLTSSVPTGTDTKLRSITLSPGRYLLFAHVVYASNATGRRFLSISTSSTNIETNLVVSDSRNAVNGGKTRMSMVGYAAPTSSTTYYLWTNHTSGSTLTVSPYDLYAVQLP